MRGVHLGVIATQSGHVDTRMTEKHYAHFPKLGITRESKVMRIQRNGEGERVSADCGEFSVYSVR